MLKISLQFFAHKKGVGSTKNGRDSESKRLGVKRADGQTVPAGNILVDEYDENRHFFLGHYFYDNYDKFMESLPTVTSGIEISKIEV